MKSVVIGMTSPALLRPSFDSDLVPSPQPTSVPESGETGTVRRDYLVFVRGSRLGSES